MKQYFAFVVVVWYCLWGAPVLARTNVQQAFIDHSIAPGIISVPPSSQLVIRYSKTGSVVNLGNEIPAALAQSSPEFYYQGEPRSYYTLAIIDPDAPSRQCPTESQWLHGLLVNIPSGSSISKADIVYDYIGPRPGPYTGYHRFIYLLYKQPGKLSFRVNFTRTGFSISSFALTHRLGHPVAGNFFYTSHNNGFLF